jgi:hypothetical protein
MLAAYLLNANMSFQSNDFNHVENLPLLNESLLVESLTQQYGTALAV